MKNLIGQILLNQFRVDAFVASGGMGVVYRVWDLKRSVALAMKVLHAELSEDPSLLKRFQREARALEKLAHPNIVPFYGLYRTRDIVFLLERYIDGPSLKEILKIYHGQSVPMQEVLIYLKSLCAALGYAHFHGVVHCDIKPGNVMIDRGGNIYLTDFGIARHAESTTTTLATIGTSAYMAPEQIQGAAVSPATDVYSLGIVLFEMLTGRRPFQGDEIDLESRGSTISERIRFAHMMLQPPDPRSLRPSIPTKLSDVVLKSLAKQPSERFATTQELLGAALFGLGISADKIPDRVSTGTALGQTDRHHGHDEVSVLIGGPSGKDTVAGGSHSPLPQKLPRLSGVKAVFFLGGVVLFFVMAIFMIIGFPDNPIPDTYQTGSTGNIPGISVMRTSTADTPPALSSTQIPGNTQPSPKTSTPDTEAIDTAVAQTIVVELTRNVAKSPTATSTRPATLTPTLTPAPAREPDAPQGKIVFTCQIFNDSKRDQICLMNADGTNWRRLTQNDRALNWYASLAPDGNSIVYSSNQTGNFEIFEVDLDGRQRQLTQDLGMLYAPEISPDGRFIVFTREFNKRQSIWVMNRDGSNPHKVYSHSDGDALDPSWSPDGQQILFAAGPVENRQLFIIDVDGSNLQQLTNMSDLRGRSDWSPDGVTIGTYAGPSWNREIYLLTTDGENLRQLTFGGNNLAPSFSPDGQWITFMSYMDNFGNDDGCEIYVMRIDGSDVVRLTNNGYCDWQPRWSR